MSNDQNQQRDLIFLGGLWLNTSQSGNRYMSGGLGIGANVMIFKNTRKAKDTDPDYMLYLAPKKRDTKIERKDNDEPPF